MKDSRNDFISGMKEIDEDFKKVKSMINYFANKSYQFDKNSK